MNNDLYCPQHPDHCVDIGKLETRMDKVETDSSVNCAQVKNKLDRKIFYSYFLPLILGAYVFVFSIYGVLAGDQKKHEESAREVCGKVQDRQYHLESKQGVTVIMFEQINGKLNTIIDQNKEIKADLKDHSQRIDRLEWGKNGE